MVEVEPSPWGAVAEIRWRWALGGEGSPPQSSSAEVNSPDTLPTHYSPTRGLANGFVIPNPSGTGGSLSTCPSVLREASMLLLVEPSGESGQGSLQEVESPSPSFPPRRRRACSQKEEPAGAWTGIAGGAQGCLHRRIPAWPRGVAPPHRLSSEPLVLHSHTYARLWNKFGLMSTSVGWTWCQQARPGVAEGAAEWPGR